METFLSIDLKITQWLNELIPRSKTFDLFFSFLSFESLIWKIAWLILVIYLARKFLPQLIISIFTAFVAVEFLLKNLFQRGRPLLPPSLCPADFSFPSGHAAIAFAAAAALAHHDKKRAWIYYTGAVLISLSRIYLGCHFFLDVLAGAVLGYFIGKRFSS